MPISRRKIRAGLRKERLSKKEISDALDKFKWSGPHAGPEDRSTALVAAAIMEQHIEDTIMRFLVNLEEEEKESIFGSEDEGFSLSRKINLGYALGIYDKSIRDDLHRVRLIRNAFAHSRKPMDFDTPEIKEACKFNVVTELWGDSPDRKFPTTSKEAFIAGVAISIIWNDVHINDLIKAGILEPASSEQAS